MKGVRAEWLYVRGGRLEHAIRFTNRALRGGQIQFITFSFFQMLAFIVSKAV